MKLIEHINQLILEEEKRLNDLGLPIEEFDYNIEQNEKTGVITKTYTGRSKHFELNKIKNRILRSELYTHKNFNKYDFENYETKQNHQDYMLQKAKAFVSKPQGTFFLSGQTGVGKSHLCTAMFKDLLLQGFETKYIVWQDELDRIKSLDFDERNKEVLRLGTVEVLYIDDFLKTSYNDGKITDSDSRTTNNIINHRYTRGLITIISTELNYNEIANIHTSMAGRLLEMTDTDNGNYFILVKHQAGRNYRENFAPKAI